VGISDLPSEIRDEEELDEMLSSPYPETIEDLKHIDGDFLVLGAGGKIGPSLIMMLARILEKIDPSRKVYAVSRFTRKGVVDKLSRYKNVEIIELDLSSRKAIDLLPEEHYIYGWQEVRHRRRSRAYVDHEHLYTSTCRRKV